MRRAQIRALRAEVAKCLDPQRDWAVVGHGEVRRDGADAHAAAVPIRHEDVVASQLPEARAHGEGGQDDVVVGVVVRLRGVTGQPEGGCGRTRDDRSAPVLSGGFEQRRRTRRALHAVVIHLDEEDDRVRVVELDGPAVVLVEAPLVRVHEGVLERRAPHGYRAEVPQQRLDRRRRVGRAGESPGPRRDERFVLPSLFPLAAFDRLEVGGRLPRDLLVVVPPAGIQEGGHGPQAVVHGLEVGVPCVRVVVRRGAGASLHPGEEGIALVHAFERQGVRIRHASIEPHFGVRSKSATFVRPGFGPAFTLPPPVSAFAFACALALGARDEARRSRGYASVSGTRW